MRTGILICCMGLAWLGGSTGWAQTSDPAATAMPAPAQGGTTNSLPQPATTSQQTIETKPGYAQQPGAIEMRPVPEKAPQPTVTQSQPTAEAPYTAMPAYGTPIGAKVHEPGDSDGSPYIPVDSWVYPAMMRLYSMGYLDTMFLSMRPYTRRSAMHMLQQSEDAILSSDNHQAQDLLAGLLDELDDEGTIEGAQRGTVYGLHSVYTRVLGVAGPILQDSFHLGQSFYNDYGRPDRPGFNDITGFSTLNERGRFSLFVRGEYQHGPSATGYSQALSSQLSIADQIPFSGFNDPQDTIPTGPIAGINPFRLVEATLSVHLFGHEISGGKSDAWQGPGMGGAMSWSNNAENIYSFKIDRVEPLYIPLVSKLTGPVRYNFFYGSLKGHTYPNSPYVHSEMFSFAPTKNFQFAFQRTIVFGGEGHEPVTLHTFLKGFFSLSDTNQALKFSRDDPGARFSSFTFSYRLPFVRDWLTLYTDSETHDDAAPTSAPRRAGYRPGIYLSHFPKMKRLDLRVEGVSTDCATLVCQAGGNEYTETIQKQAYTNKGFILGDWIGREAKGGQAWMTYHLSANEWVQISYLNKKTPKDFIVGTYDPTTGTYGSGGTTQNQFKLDVLKRIRPDVELNAWLQVERWKAPVYLPGQRNDTAVAVQVTWFPKLKTIR